MRRKRRSSLVTKPMRPKKKDSSATQSLKIMKRKRGVSASGDKLIVRIRNKKEKIAAAAAALEDGEDDDDEEETEDGDVIKSEPV